MTLRTDIFLYTEKLSYGEVEKWGEKWSTLTNYFSADFHREFVKYWTKLSEK